MKSILIGVVVLSALLVIVFVDYTPSASVIVPEAPEVKKTGNYDRPVKDGTCFIQTDTAGNKLRICF